jgi:glycosyltransferase involved in cell wall biosynthesis
VSAPLVSVLTPSFEQGRWLRDNLRSVAAQTHPHIEQLVMDGGSSDNTVDVLKRSERPGLRWWSEPDRGQSDALNKALALSNGSIIGWLNSDDAYFSRTVIADVVRVFERRSDLAVVYGHSALVNADGLLLHLVWAPPFSRRLLKLHDFITQPAAFIRRDALGPYLADEAFQFAMDYELWLRLSATRRFGRLNRVLAIDRHHGARKSTTIADVMLKDLDRLHERYGVRTGSADVIARKVWKIASRIAGAALIPGAIGQPFAFDGHVDRRLSLLLRQIATPRSVMPMGDLDQLGRTPP